MSVRNIYHCPFNNEFDKEQGESDYEVLKFCVKREIIKTMADDAVQELDDRNYRSFDNTCFGEFREDRTIDIALSFPSYLSANLMRRLSILIYHQFANWRIRFLATSEEWDVAITSKGVHAFGKVVDISDEDGWTNMHRDLVNKYRSRLNQEFLEFAEVKKRINSRWQMSDTIMCELVLSSLKRNNYRIWLLCRGPKRHRFRLLFPRDASEGELYSVNENGEIGVLYESPIDSPFWLNVYEYRRNTVNKLELSDSLTVKEYVVTVGQFLSFQ